MVAWKDPEEWLEGRTHEGDSRWKWPLQQAGVAGGRNAGAGAGRFPAEGPQRPKVGAKEVGSPCRSCCGHLLPLRRRWWAARRRCPETPPPPPRCSLLVWLCWFMVVGD